MERVNVDGLERDLRGIMLVGEPTGSRAGQLGA